MRRSVQTLELQCQSHHDWQVNTHTPLTNQASGFLSKCVTSSYPPTGKRGVLKRPWSEAERAAVEEHLTQNINELRVPAKADCERCLQQCPLLVSNHRDWRAIKFYCHNRIQLLKKNQRRESDPQPLTVCWGRGSGVLSLSAYYHPPPLTRQQAALLSRPNFAKFCSYWYEVRFWHFIAAPCSRSMKTH